MSLRRLLPMLAVLAALPARGEDRYLAVLELGGTADRFAREALADRVRAEATEALRTRWFVTTRENVLERLRRTGKACTATDVSCSVELGRAVGAELVVDGAANTLPDGRIDIALALHDTASGRAVAAVEAEYNTAVRALDGMREVVLALLQQRNLVAPGPIDLYDPGFGLELRALGTLPIIQYSGPMSGNPVAGIGVLGSYRVRERWALEAQFAREFYSGEDQAVGGDVLHFAVGGEFTPSSRHATGIAAGAGATRLRRRLNDATTLAGDPALRYAQELETAPMAYVEFRLNLNLGVLQFGARLGARGIWKQTALVSPGGVNRVKPALQVDIPFVLSARIAL